MKTAQEINDSFRKEIRNRQKQALFKTIRSMHTTGQDIMMLSEKGVPSANNQASLMKMAEGVKGNDGVRYCNSLIDQGIHHTLLQNLSTNTLLSPTLDLLSTLLSHQKIKISHKIVPLGLIEHLLRLSKIHVYTSICMNILANIVFENVQYGEMMLENKVHLHMFDLLREIVLENQGRSKEDQGIGFLVIWALAALLEVENTLPYKEHFLEILNFSLQVVLKKQLYTSTIIEIIFLVGYSFRQQTQNLAHGAISSILAQASSQSKYIQSLLITIKLLSPLPQPVDYLKISNLAVQSQGKTVTYCLRILEKVVGIFVGCVPCTQEWWHHLYAQLYKVEDVECYAIMIRKAAVRGEFVYPILADMLEKFGGNEITLANEVLQCVNGLLETSKSIQERNAVKFYLKSHGVQNQLLRLYQHKNGSIHKKCEYLLTAMNV